MIVQIGSISPIFAVKIKQVFETTTYSDVVVFDDAHPRRSCIFRGG